MLLAGCAATDNDTFSSSRDATRVLPVDDQPQTAVAGEGSLMPGAYEPRQLPTGQFTGQERTPAVIGQNPVVPRETDVRQMDRSGPIDAAGRGAGTLGQAGIAPANTPGTVSPSATDIYRSSEPNAIGAPPGLERGTSVTQTNNPTPPKAQ
jgi:hypothetical protein